MADLDHAHTYGMPCTVTGCRWPLRTQAERDADGTTWRAAAQSRPGYCTWPQTAPGNPSWWLRDLIGVRTADGRLYAPQDVALVYPDTPPPVDGETCAKWCGFCHLGPDPRGIAPECSTSHPQIHAGCDGCDCHCHGPAAPTVEPPADPDIWMTTEPIAPPRRRWWHRYTRRNV